MINQMNFKDFYSELQDIMPHDCAVILYKYFKEQEARIGAPITYDADMIKAGYSSFEDVNEFLSAYPQYVDNYDDVKYYMDSDKLDAQNEFKKWLDDEDKEIVLYDEGSYNFIVRNLQ